MPFFFMHLILCSFTPLKNALQERWRTSLNSRDPGEHFPCSAQHGLTPSRAKASRFLIPWECLMLEPDYKIKLKKKKKTNQNPRRPPSFPDEMGGGRWAGREKNKPDKQSSRFGTGISMAHPSEVSKAAGRRSAELCLADAHGLRHSVLSKWKRL